jgi:hypothetical protein
MPGTRIIGAHAILYSRSAEADRAFLRDVVGFPSVDVGHGWLIFALPPAEVAVHPTEGEEAHELYLMVEDVEAFVAGMAARGVTCSPVRDLRWGILTEVSLPSGARLGVYQPRHARPSWTSGRATRGGAAAKKRKPARATRAARAAGRRR